jgi:hypothetical protein
MSLANKATHRYWFSAVSLAATCALIPATWFVLRKGNLPTTLTSPSHSRLHGNHPSYSPVNIAMDSLCGVQRKIDGTDAGEADVQVKSAVPAGPAARGASRAFAHKTKGSTHGPITRLVSPGDVGQLIKPFIFLDAFSSPPPSAGGFQGTVLLVQ